MFDSIDFYYVYILNIRLEWSEQLEEPSFIKMKIYSKKKKRKQIDEKNMPISFLALNIT